MAAYLNKFNDLIIQRRIAAIQILEQLNFWIIEFLNL